MCEFISWIEKEGRILFLLDGDMSALDRKNWNKDKSERCGHGAIRFLYDLGDTGINKECVDFSAPKNFPPEIAEAIKQGKLTYGLQSNSVKLILTHLAWDEYKKITQPALVEYVKILQSALAEYEKIKQPALVEYVKITQPIIKEIIKDSKNRNENWQ